MDLLTSEIGHFIFWGGNFGSELDIDVVQILLAAAI